MARDLLKVIRPIACVTKALRQGWTYTRRDGIEHARFPSI
jgi:hypothetical protein